MKEFIFYTFEGRTISPNGELLENIQVLGFELANNEVEAKKQLMQKNQWIREKGFCEKQIICRQIV